MGMEKRATSRTSQTVLSSKTSAPKSDSYSYSCVGAWLMSTPIIDGSHNLWRQLTAWKILTVTTTYSYYYINPSFDMLLNSYDSCGLSSYPFFEYAPYINGPVLGTGQNLVQHK